MRRNTLGPAESRTAVFSTDVTMTSCLVAANLNGLFSPALAQPKAHGRLRAAFQELDLNVDARRVRGKKFQCYNGMPPPRPLLLVRGFFFKKSNVPSVISVDKQHAAE